MNKPKLIIFAAPSGSGKTTMMKAVREIYPDIHFSLSATTRKIRNGETENVDYRYLSLDEFKTAIKDNKLLEWEEVYKNKFYGTLESELHYTEYTIFDMDVKGALNLKKIFGDDAISIFLEVDIEKLRNRLIVRNTDSMEDIEERLSKAKKEVKYKDLFDAVIYNNDLEKAKSDSIDIVTKWISDK